MNLYFKRVRFCGRHYRNVKRLYRQAFPPIEQLPLLPLTLMALRPGVDFYAVYDDAVFCGLVYLLSDRNHTLIFYFAVDTDLRSKGYGAQILNWIKSRKNTVSLIMESMREECDNPEQRLRRNEFYLRNGFFDTGYYMQGSGQFDILCTDPGTDPSEYAKLLRLLMSWLGHGVQIGKF